MKPFRRKQSINQRQRYTIASKGQIDCTPLIIHALSCEILIGALIKKINAEGFQPTFEESTNSKLTKHVQRGLDTNTSIGFAILRNACKPIPFYYFERLKGVSQTITKNYPGER
jgi:hypothetical protein